MVINVRSRKLLSLFNEVWRLIPNKRDKALLSKRIMLVTDNIDFIPIGTKPKWGAVISVRFKKSLAVLYLSPRRLPGQPAGFVRHTIASLLAHVVLGHLEEIDNEARWCDFEKAADKQAREWGYAKIDA